MSTITMTMRAAAAGLALAAASAGCAGAGSSAPLEARPATDVTAAPPTTTTTTAPPATTTTQLELPASVAEQMYLAVVRDRHGDVWADISDAELIAYPVAACTALDAGAPVTAVLEVAESAFYDEETAAAGGFALGAGIEAFCPEYTYLITEVTP